MSNVSVESNLFKGNLAVHASDNVTEGGDGSCEIQGKLYTDIIQPYTSNLSVIVCDTNTFTTTSCTVNNLTANGTISFPNNPLGVPSGGTGLNNITKNRILIGNNTSSISTSSLLTFDTTTNTLSVNTVVISGSLTVSGGASIDTLTLGSPLAGASGGTGINTITANQVIYGGTLNKVAQSTNFLFDPSTNILNVTGSGLFSATLGVTGLISGSSISLTGGVTTQNLVANGTVSFPNNPLGVVSGGTGVNSIAAGNIIFGGTATTIAQSTSFTYVTGTGTLSVPKLTLSATPLAVSSGGIARTAVADKQILYGSGTAAIGQSVTFIYDVTSDTLSATNLSVSGTCTLTTNPLLVTSGGTGLNAVAATNILFGGTSTILAQSTSFTYSTSTSTLSAPKLTLTTPLAVSSGGIGRNAVADKQILFGLGTTAIDQSLNLTFDSGTNTLNTVNLTLTSPLLVTSGGTGLAVIPASQIPFGSTTTAVSTSSELSYIASTRTLASPSVSNGTCITTSFLSCPGDVDVSALLIPISEFTALTTVFNGEAMTASSSSNYISSVASEGFRNVTTRYWQSAFLYTAATGVYTGTVSTTASAVAVSGEWLQLYMGNARRLTAVTISGRDTTWTSRCPRAFTLCASNDGITWTTLITRTGVQDWVEATPKTYTFTNSLMYSYYRFIITQVGNLTSGGSSQVAPNISLRYTSPSKLTVQSSLQVGTSASNCTFLPPATTDTNVQYTLPSLAPTTTNRFLSSSTTGVLAWNPTPIRVFNGSGANEVTYSGLKIFTATANVVGTQGRANFYPTSDGTATGTAIFTVFHSIVSSPISGVTNAQDARWSTVSALSTDLKNITITSVTGIGTVLLGYSVQFSPAGTVISICVTGV